MEIKGASGTSFQTTNRINSDASSMSQKYGGLIHRSPYKKFRMNMIMLFNYVYTIAPEFQILHDIVTVVRILQLVGPSLVEADPSWQVDNVSSMSSGILSIFWHLLPPFVREIGGSYICYIYAGVSIVMFILIAGSSFYFTKFAQLPQLIPWVIAAYFAIVNFIFPPIALNFTFELLGRVTFQKDLNLPLLGIILTPVLDLGCFIIFSWLFTIIVTQTLVFRPISLMTVMISTQNILFFAVNLINILLGFGSFSVSIPQAVIMVVVALLYLCVAYLPFYQGGFVNKTLGAIVSAGGITGAVMCIIHMVTSLMKFDVGLPLIFIQVLLFVLLCIVMKNVTNVVTNRHLLLLDRFQDEKNLDIIKSPLHLINCAVDGMTVAHPCCISWDIFKSFIDTWPRDSRLWYVFAKFCSIYPEDTQTISWIYHSVLASKLRGATARTIKEQTLTIAKQRESNLSPSLKVKLNSVQKQLQNSKHKLRHVWDLAIQGNIGEMEASIKKFYKQQNKVDAEFKHLFRQYPNNRFVTRTYARFCKEIMANHQDYVDFIEKSRQLQRGLIVNEDSVHKFGMFSYPNLPSKFCTKVADNATSAELNQSSLEMSESEDDTVVDESVTSSIRDNIEKLTIPSIFCTKVSRIAMLCVIFVAVMIALFIYSAIFINDLTDPLVYLYELSLLETKSMMLMTFGVHYFYEQTGDYNPVIPQATPPKLFGGVYDTREMLFHIISQVSTATQDIYSFRSFKSNNSNVKEAQNLVFGSSVNYVYFNGLESNKTIKQTLQTGVMDIVTQISNMMKEPVITGDMVNRSYILNPIYNLEAIYDCFDDALNLLIQFVRDKDLDTQKISEILMIVGIVFVVVVFIFALIYQLIWIQNNKEEAYRCLTALPKNAVSALVENLRVLKNEDGNDTSTCTDTEMSKQEDNIMKTLVTGGDTSSSKIADRVLLIIGSLLTIALEVISIYLFSTLFTYESKRLIVSAPHMNYLTSTYAQGLASHYLLQIMSLRFENNPNRTHIISDEELELIFIKRRTAYRDYYHLARFGGRSVDEAPFIGFSEGVAEANKYIKCNDETTMPTDFMDMAGCYDVETLYVLFGTILYTTYLKQIRGSINLTAKLDTFDYLWTLLISPIYDGMFGPMFTGIIGTIEEELDIRQAKDYPILIILLVIGVVFEVVVFFQILNIENHIRSVLNLLLHCQQSVVLNTQKIMMVLHGDFSKMKGDITKRNAEFFDTVFLLLPDALMICDSVSYNIISVSKACSRILFMNEEDIIGKNVKELLAHEQFSGDVSSLFKSSCTTPVEITEKDSEGSITNLEVSTMKTNNQYVLIIRDITSTVRYNKLIQDERAKSDALLAAILPPSLVMRVQSGEKNISFSVQSATIVFMDIVSFTPWCGSNEATKVMKTLNLLFKYFDAACAKYPTMTKIKCIGDCYMAAGGIFSEINNPPEHAKEVVSFGVDALECVRNLDQELDEKLQIRVGINTGGPIVAGVLGIGKPTFEILGPAINMAQQMEHHGVPMAVHISRSVYELIYGESFKIKERGSIEVKNGSVLTYIVEDKI